MNKAKYIFVNKFLKKLTKEQQFFACLQEKNVRAALASYNYLDKDIFKILFNDKAEEVRRNLIYNKRLSRDMLWELARFDSSVWIRMSAESMLHNKYFKGNE